MLVRGQGLDEDFCAQVGADIFGIFYHQDFPGGSDGKASAYNAGDLGLIPGWGRFSGGENGNPLQYSCPENPMGEAWQATYSPWGRKESDMTEQLYFTLPRGGAPGLSQKTSFCEECHPGMLSGVIRLNI